MPIDTTEVTVISDTEYSEENDYAYLSDQSDIVVVSVSSPAPEPPPSSQPRSTSWGDVFSIWDHSDVENGEDSEADLLDPADVVSASQSQKTTTGHSKTASGTQSQTSSSASITPEKRKRTYSAGYSDSDESLVVEAVPEKPKKRRKKKTEEEKIHEKAAKEATKLAKQEETRRKKEAAAAEKAAQKQAKKVHKEANKLVTDKKATLADMTIELSNHFLVSPLCEPLRKKMEEFRCFLAPITNNEAEVVNSATMDRKNLNDLGMKLIRWRRQVTANYDEHKRQWIPLEEDQCYMRLEGTYLIFVEGRPDMRNASVTDQVRRLRAALGPKHHVHLMICGWKPRGKEDRERFEEELVGLQVRERIFVEQVPNIEQAVNWIYNMTADLGIKPHKLIERSHLSFCAEGSSAVKVGQSEEDTMIRMLTQLPRLTEPTAKAIAREYKTMNGIMDTYSKLEDEGPAAGAKMIAEMELNRTRTGKEISRRLGNVLSERLYMLLWGNDPKILLN